MISFNTNKNPQYTRPNNTIFNSNNNNKSLFCQTIPNRQSPQKNQKLVNLSSNNINNMVQLTQDLSKLKEQLKRLSNHGEQLMSSSQVNQEPAIFKQAQRPKSSLISDGHIGLRKDFSCNELSYPNRLQSHRNEISDRNAQNKSIENINQQRVVPIINPNKRQSERLIRTINNTQSRIFQPNNNSNQYEITNLRQKVTNLQQELQKSRTENQNVKIELSQIKEKLKQKELQKNLLTATKNIQQEEFQKRFQLQLQRNQHIEVVQKLYQQIDIAKKAVVITGQQFDVAIKSQIYANQELKKQLSQQQEYLATLKDQIQDQTNTILHLNKQLQIQQLKISADYRAKLQRIQIILAQKDIEIQNNKRSLQTLDFRYRASLKQLKQKDQFIMNYFVHRSSDGLKSQVSEFFRTYKAQFTTPATLQLFLKEQQQIQQLRKNLKAP